MEELELVKRSSRRYYFQGRDIDYYFSWFLGRLPSRGAEIAELYRTTERIDESAPSSWAPAWLETAGNVEAFAGTALEKGRTVSAKDAFLRASSYYRGALMGLKSTDPGFEAAMEKSRLCFMEAARLFDPPIEPFEIPFEGQTLPGYFMKAEPGDAARPTLIMIGGLETWLEDLYFMIAPGGTARGYNVLAVDLPGQGGNPLKGMYHRPDSEASISAVVDYALGRPDVDADRLAVFGVSFGGYLVTRAVMFEKRIKACIADAPIIDLYKFTATRMPDTVMNADASLLAVDSFPVIALEKVCWALGVGSPKEVTVRIRDFVIEDELNKIECPFLALAGAGESEEQQRQARQCIDALNVPKKALRITTVEEGSDAHGHVDNISFLSALVFDWLDEVFEL